MRANHFLMLLAVSLTGLSGCLGFGDDDGPADEQCPADDHHDGNATADHTHDCPGEDTEDALGNQTDGNVTDVPNELPVANLTMTSGDGAMVNNTTFVFVGSNITFSAEGSADPDGGIDLIGLTVRDRNSTRTAQLYQDGAFVDATFTFEHEGAVNVTLRVLDDHGEATVLETATFVNRVQATSVDISGGGGASAPGADADDCESPTSAPGGTAPGDITGKPAGFQVAAGAQWIEATLTGGSGEIAICSPEGTALSGSDSSYVVTDEGVELPPSISYYVMVLSGSMPDQTYTLDIVVHHEPRPADL